RSCLPPRGCSLTRHATFPHRAEGVAIARSAPRFTEGTNGRIVGDRAGRGQEEKLFVGGWGSPDGYILYLPSSSSDRPSSHFWSRPTSMDSLPPLSTLRAVWMTVSSTKIGDA